MHPVLSSSSHPPTPNQSQSEPRTPQKEGYSSKLRDSTQAKHTQISPPFSSRKVLPLSNTPSLVRPKGHQCDEFNSIYTRTKIDVRVSTTFQLFALAYFGRCELKKRKTEWNGSTAHCKGQCHAAHAAFHPSLTTNRLDKIEQDIETNGWKKISPWSKEFVQRRISKDPSKEEDPEQFAKQELKKIPNSKRKLCYGEAVTQLRNATFEGPASSNWIDCYLENTLREKELSLAAQCVEKKITPAEATSQFTDSYIQLLTQAQEKLIEIKKDFDRFVDLEARLLHPIPELNSPEDYKNFIDGISDFLTIKDRLIEKKKGSPIHIEEKINFFHKKGIYNTLRALVVNYKQNKTELKKFLTFYEATKIRLESVSHNIQIDRLKKDLDNRLCEVETQLAKLKAAKKDIPDLLRFYYGVPNEKGERLNPSESQLKKQLLDQITL